MCEAITKHTRTPFCHSERSEESNKFEILRLMPQYDILGEPLCPYFLM